MRFDGLEIEIDETIEGHNPPQGFHQLAVASFIKRNADGLVLPAQVNALDARRLPNRGGPIGGFHHHGAEEGVMLDAVVQTAQPLDQNGGQAMDPPGDPAQAVGPVVDAIHAGHDRQ